MADRAKCSGTNKDGSPCRGYAIPATAFCLFHSPDRKETCRNAQRNGGKSRMRKAAVLGPDAPDVPLTSAAEVTAFLGQAVGMVLKGTIDPKIANAAGFLVGLLLRSFEVGQFEERLAALEASAKERRP